MRKNARFRMPCVYGERWRTVPNWMQVDGGSLHLQWLRAHDAFESAGNENWTQDSVSDVSR